MSSFHCPSFLINLPQDCLFSSSFSEEVMAKETVLKTLSFQSLHSSALSELATISQHAPQASSSDADVDDQTSMPGQSSVAISSTRTQPVSHYAFDQFVYHPTFRDFIVQPSPGDLTLSPKNFSEGGLCWVKCNKTISKGSGCMRWQILLNMVPAPGHIGHNFLLGVAKGNIDLLANNTQPNNIWAFGSRKAHFNGKVVLHSIGLTEGDLVTLELDRQAETESATLFVTVERNGSRVGQFKFKHLSASADFFPVVYLSASCSYTFVPFPDVHDDTVSISLTKSSNNEEAQSSSASSVGCAVEAQSSSASSVGLVPIDSCEDIVLQVDVADAERGNRKNSLSELDDFSEV